jgi:hypothetical protein
MQEPKMFVRLNLQYGKPAFADQTEVTDADLAAINGLKVNGPLKILGKEDVFVRRYIILGVEPTSYKSVHPEGELNGKQIHTLSELAKTLPGCPMMEAHDTGKLPWGRVFRAEVIPALAGYSGPVLQASYFFLKNTDGVKRAAAIDAGIHAEGSISYSHRKTHCSICHKEMMVASFMGMLFTSSKCLHKIGESYDGQICYWYPSGLTAREISSVYAGAYRKTKGQLSMAYSDEEERVGAELLEAILDDHNKQEVSHVDEDSPAAPAELAVESQRNDGAGNGENAGGASGGNAVAPGGQQNAGEPPVPAPAVPAQPPAPVVAQQPDPAALVKCGGCGADFDYGKQPEIAMGSVACPVCKKTVDQTGKVLEVPPAPSEELSSAKVKYWVCPNPKCGYWQDPNPERKLGEAKCPKCGALLVGASEKPGNALSGAEALGEKFKCECIKCGHKQESDQHCNTLKCPKCGGDMRREERPGPGQPTRKKYLLCQGCGHSIETALLDPGTEVPECVECGGAMDLEVDELPAPPAELEICLALGSAFGPVKPAKSGAAHNEFFTLDAFKKLEGSYIVEPKYDGVSCELHKKNGDVKLMTDGGTDLTKKFPNMVAEAEKLTQDNFAVAGEVVRYRGSQRGTHTDVTAYINSGGPYEDYHFRFKLFDTMVENGRDVTGSPLSERQKLTDAIPNTAHIHKVKHNLAKTGEGVVRAIRALSTREGAMVKSVDMTYNAAGRKDIYKWKRQADVDAKVKTVHGTKGSYTYSCEVGIGDEAQVIGTTYVTSIEAKVGDILKVSVDHVTEKDGKYTWYAPKVIALRTDKTEPDPIATLKKIAEKGGPAKRAKHMLSEIIPKLAAMEREETIFICGGLIVKGESEHDIDLVSKAPWSDALKANIIAALQVNAEEVDFIHNENGPEGPAVELAGKPGVVNVKYAKRFVLQHHYWGKASHYDLRFGNPTGDKMWGFTCFKEPTKVAGGPKIQCQEKQYHDVKWMDFNGTIKPGNPGNPTKDLIAHMDIVDKGSYDFIERKAGFVEVVLHGKHWEGRYVFREIAVTAADKHAEHAAKGDDEAKHKSNKIWVMWKTKDQTTGKPVKQICFRFQNNALLLWEGEQDA